MTHTTEWIIYIIADKVLLESHGAVVVAQLVERSLLTPEIRGSNPDIGKVLSTNCTIEKTKIKKKRPEWPNLKKNLLESHSPNNCEKLKAKCRKLYN